MAPLEFIRYACANGVATLTLSRPEKLNALTDELMAELAIALEHCAQDDEVQVVVLTGAGRAFSAGFDISTRAVPRVSVNDSCMMAPSRGPHDGTSLNAPRTRISRRVVAVVSSR